MNSINGGILVKRSYSVELNFTNALAAGKMVNFKDVQELRRVYVYGVEIFTQDQQTRAKSGAPNITLPQAATLVITLTEGTTDKVREQPATSFVASVNGGMFRLYDKLRLNLVKSFAKAIDAGVNAGDSLIIVFYYEDIDMDVLGVKPQTTTKKK